MRKRIKKILKATLPECLLRPIWKIGAAAEVLYTRTVFALARRDARWLDLEALDRYNAQYPPLSREGDWDSAAEIAARIDHLTQSVPNFAAISTILETGAGGAELAVSLARTGKRITAVDLYPKPNPAVEELGLPFLKMDVTNMAFPDGAFDCVISFDAMEHFMEPDKALAEMLRVAKKGGFVYLEFGPLYFSRLGLHIYRCLGIPYSQYLFDYAMMERYIEDHNLPRIVPKTLNRWSVRDYDRLWKRYGDRARIVLCRKFRDTTHLDIIRRHPRLFKSQTRRFEDLVISGLRVVLRKR